MTRYRKKPIEIEAIQFTGGNVEEIAEFMGIPIMDLQKSIYELVSGPYSIRMMPISTLEGVMTAASGDWIIKGVKGEFYPCKPDIFDATYEEVK